MLPQDAYAKREDVRFLDVREPHEFAAGHVPGSVHVPLMTLQQQFTELDSDVTWVVTCQVGQRSDMAARFLRVRGFDAHNLDGGLEAWMREGLPVGDGTDGDGRLVDGRGGVLDWLPESKG